MLRTQLSTICPLFLFLQFLVCALPHMPALQPTFFCLTYPHHHQQQQQQFLDSCHRWDPFQWDFLPFSLLNFIFDLTVITALLATTLRLVSIFFFYFFCAITAPSLSLLEPAFLFHLLFL